MRKFLLILALASSCLAVTPPAEVKVPPGFKVELLREAGPSEGSWICMAIDDKGRLYISSQNNTPESGFTKDSKWGGMWRATLGEGTTKGAKGAKGAKDGEILNPKSEILNWEKIPIPVGDAMGMLWAFDSLYVSGQGPDGRGIYRCKDTDGDGTLDSAVLFKAVPDGAGEHGAHAIILGPDKKLYIVHGNTAPILSGLSPDSPYRNWGEDNLLPRVGDPVATFFDKIKPPYGCVYRTDENGTKWELFAGGFRNPYDIAFNTDGELFTYDSDMEWDRGLPWYRPTRLLHVVPGGEYGFREGSAKWPPWYPDSLPAVCDIGVGCPTGMTFGTKATGWPAQYQRALFFIDWTYGRILAAHLHEKGASYIARNDIKSYTYPKEAEANHDVEVFLSGKGMPMTDMEFGKDGALYFTTGGRGTSAALYRVSYMESGTAEKTGDDSSQNRRTRFSLDMLEHRGEIESGTGDAGHLLRNPGNLIGRLKAEYKEYALRYSRDYIYGMIKEALQDPTWRWFDSFNLAPALRGADPVLTHFICRIVETAIIDQKAWHLMLPNESNQAILYAALCRARVCDSAQQDSILESLKPVQIASLPDDLKLLKLRVLELTFARQGRPSAENVKALVAELSRQYPAKGPEAAKLNRELSQLLIWLTNPELGELTSDLAAKAAAPAEPPKTPAPAPAPAGGKSGSVSPHMNRAGDAERFSAVPVRTSGGVKETSLETNRTSTATGPNKGRFIPTSGQFIPTSGGFIPASEGFIPAGAGFIPTGGGFIPVGGGFIPTSGLFIRTCGQFIRTTWPFIGTTSPVIEFIPGGHAIVESGKRGLIRFIGSELAKGATVFLSGATLAAVDVAPAPAPAASGKTPIVPEKEGTPTTPQAAPATSLGPVPNPGASVFPGRKGGDALQAVVKRLGQLRDLEVVLLSKYTKENQLVKITHAEIEELERQRRNLEAKMPNGDLDTAGRDVIEKTLALMDAAESQEEQIWYALVLRMAHGWTPEQRARYFRWFHEKAGGYAGGNSLSGFINKIRTEALARCTDAERTALGHLASAPTAKALVELKPRAFVQAWTMTDLEPALSDVAKGRNFARGRELFGQAQCILCHKMGVTGGNVGPDLSAVAQRFPRKDILTAILDPNAAVSDQYAMMMFTVRRGEKLQEVVGLVQEDTGGTYTVLTDPLSGKTEAFYHHVVVKKEKSPASIMPPGLLYTLTKEEVLDLLAYLEAGGKEDAANFK